MKRETSEGLNVGCIWLGQKVLVLHSCLRVCQCCFVFHNYCINIVKRYGANILRFHCVTADFHHGNSDTVVMLTEH